MPKDIDHIIKQSTWCIITHNTLQKLPNGKYPMLHVTSDFNLKRLPNGSPLKFKSLYFVRGVKKSEGVDYFETYAPVVIWSTIHLALTMIL